MQHLYHKASKLGASIILLLTSASAFSGTPTPTGSVTFTSINPANVPTLSTTMIIVLSLLLFVVAIKISKQKQTNLNKFFVLMFGAGFLISTGNGLKLISDAAAVVAVPNISINENISAPIDLYYGAINFTNDTVPSVSVKFTIQPRIAAACEYSITGGISVLPSQEIATGILEPEESITIYCNFISSLPD